MNFIIRIVKTLIFTISAFYLTFVQANDYMSVELRKAVSIECNKLVDNNEFNSIEECTNYKIETLNVVGVVSVTRINDLEIQKKIETICVFKKKVGALEYNTCIHEQVYKAIGLEIIEMPLVLNVPTEEETDGEENVQSTDDDTTAQSEDAEESEQSAEDIKVELDIEKQIFEVAPDRPITNAIEIPMPKDILKLISEKAVPSTYYVQTWKLNPNTDSKFKYKPSGSGSAVVIGDNLLATACHVVTERFYNEKDQKIEYEYLITNLLHVNDDVTDQTMWHRRAELFSEDFLTDRCIIKHEDINVKSPSLRDYGELEEFETVYAVGNPRGFLGKTASGKITRLYDHVPPVKSLSLYFASKNIELIETDAPLDKGNSGGGLFDIDGNLIGIASRCEVLGGPIQCYDEYGYITLEDVPADQCQLYCNKTQPQNWFIPISRYEELEVNQ